MIKLSVVAVLFAVVIVSAQDDHKFWPTMKVCIKELGIKTDKMGRPDKEEAAKKCLSKCVSLRLGTMDDKGTVIISKLPQHMRKDAEECDKSSTNTDVCKRAELFGKCLMEKMSSKHKKLREECAKETNTTLEKDEKWHHGPRKFDEKKACFSRCLSIRTGFLKDNDEVNVEAFKKWNPKKLDDVEKSVKACQNQNAQSDKCIKSAKTIHCIWETLKPKHNKMKKQ